MPAAFRQACTALLCRKFPPAAAPALAEPDAPAAAAVELDELLLVLPPQAVSNPPAINSELAAMANFARWGMEVLPLLGWGAGQDEMEMLVAVTVESVPVVPVTDTV
jgi:hypothetical protein